MPKNGSQEFGEECTDLVQNGNRSIVLVQLLTNKDLQQESCSFLGKSGVHLSGPTGPIETRTKPGLTGHLVVALVRSYGPIETQVAPALTSELFWLHLSGPTGPIETEYVKRYTSEV